MRPLTLLRLLTAPAPKRFLIAPQDIRTADPTVADDVHDGHFAFAGRIVSIRGGSPFAIAPPSLAWAKELMSFEWLRHLRAADTPAIRADARLLVDAWIRNPRDVSGLGWEPRMVARRLLSWLSQSPLILNEADYAFYRRFMKSVGRQTAYLRQALAGGLEGEQRLFGAIAVAAVGLCAEGLPSVEQSGTRLLMAELRRQILPQGDHISRNPRLLCELLLDLLPLRQVYVGRGQKVPDELLGAIERMLPRLRFFRHGDGALALFNGMGVTAPEVLATLLAYADPRAPATVGDTDSTYVRLRGGDTIVIMDAGRPPPPVFSGEAHAGCLAFELSIGSQRVVVNCGAPTSSRPELQEAARATKAHSTLVLADASSCRFVAKSRTGAPLGTSTRIADGPRNVTCERESDASGASITASHDGYASQFGAVHQRFLWLATDGRRLRGRDGVALLAGKSAPANDFALHFHLHPTVDATVSSAPNSVELRLRDGAMWVFETTGGSLELSDAVFFAASEGVSRSKQIVARPAASQPAAIDWSLTRVS